MAVEERRFVTVPPDRLGELLGRWGLGLPQVTALPFAVLSLSVRRLSPWSCCTQAVRETSVLLLDPVCLLDTQPTQSRYSRLWRPSRTAAAFAAVCRCFARRERARPRLPVAAIEVAASAPAGRLSTSTCLTTGPN